MKWKHVLILLLIFSAFAFSQSMRITVTDTVMNGNTGESFVFEGYVHNTTAGAIVVHMLRKTNNIPDGWTTTICFGTNCYPPSVYEATEAINPGDSMFFDITFNTDDMPGYGESLLLFEDLVNGTKDSVLFKVSTTKPKAFALGITDTLMRGRPGQSFVFETYLHNRSNDAIVVHMFRKINQIPESWTTTLCFGATCYPPFVNEATEAIQAGDSIFFDIVFNTDPARPDSGKALVVFEDLVSGEKDSVWFAVSTMMEPAIEIIATDTVAMGRAGDELDVGGFIHNLTDSLLTVKVVRIKNNIPPDWSSSLCLDVCVSPAVDTVTSVIAPDDSLGFSVTFYTADSLAGDGSVELKIFAVGTWDTLYHKVSAMTTLLAIDDGSGAPIQTFRLFGNFPNPFNPTTTIRYQLAERSIVTIDLFNVNGRLIERLFSGSQSAGVHNFKVNASALASGVYYYRVKTLKHAAYGKMILLK